ncbi:MAG: nitroreductase [Chloroflexi bacterium]|nr:nitroreductase [Chloroflexota bacterium]
MDLYEALATRRTASKFAPAMPPREAIERIIEAATWAPNHHRTQPWRFFVLAGDERARFAGELAAELEQQSASPKLIESARTKPLRSPILLVLAQHGTPDDPERDREDYAACACAAENLLLAVHAEGLAAKWSTGEMAEQPAAFTYLGLAPTDRIVAYIYLGYPADAAPPKRADRSPAAVSWRGWE